MLISGISVILSIPLTLITLDCIVVATTLFVVSAFYNMFKFIQMANVSISEAIETDAKKGLEKLKEGKRIFGRVRMIALPLAIGAGIPMVLIVLIYLWVIVI